MFVWDKNASAIALCVGLVLVIVLGRILTARGDRKRRREAERHRREIERLRTASNQHVHMDRPLDREPGAQPIKKSSGGR